MTVSIDGLQPQRAVNQSLHVEVVSYSARLTNTDQIQVLVL